MTEALDLQQRNRVALLALRTALVTWLILVGTRSETAVAVLALVLTSFASPFFVYGARFAQRG
jgi:hypothetical protein